MMNHSHKFFDEKSVMLNALPVEFNYGTNGKLLNALIRSVEKAGFDTKTVTVRQWMRQESYNDVSGLLITCPDNGRLEKWLNAWVKKQHEDPSNKRCTNWNSYYRLAVEGSGPEGVYVMTDSISIGD